jgi:hypothetical protein
MPAGDTNFLKKVVRLKPKLKEPIPDWTGGHRIDEKNTRTDNVLDCPWLFGVGAGSLCGI